MTREFDVLQAAKSELDRAVWAGGLEYADEGNFDDLAARDKFVLEKIAHTIKKLELYIKKTRPIQNNKKISKRRKTFFN